MNLVLLGASGDGEFIRKTSSTTFENAAAGSSTVTALDDLTDVVISSVANGDIIQWNGSSWVNVPLPAGGLTIETPTGAVDDSNLTFTVANEPEYIVVNGSHYVEGTGTYVSYVAGTITLSFPVGTGGFIRSYYA